MYSKAFYLQNMLGNTKKMSTKILVDLQVKHINHQK